MVDLRNINLSNLAWLGEDGTVHTVNNQVNTNGRPLLGASAPLGAMAMDPPAMHQELMGMGA